MTALWKLVYKKLVSDATLVAMLGHTATDKRIRRWQQHAATKKPCLCFMQDTGSKLIPTVEPIRDYYFTMAALSEKTDVEADDVMEHVPEEDLGWVIREIFSYAKKMVFINVACFEALKKFRDGTNVHVSVFHHQDWLQFLAHEHSYRP